MPEDFDLTPLPIIDPEKDVLRQHLRMLSMQRERTTLYQDVYTLQQQLVNSEAYLLDASTKFLADSLERLLVLHLDEKEPGHQYPAPREWYEAGHSQHEYERYLTWLRAGRPVPEKED